MICCKKSLESQIKKNNFNKKIRLLDPNDIKRLKLNNNTINLININFQSSNIKKSNPKYIEDCFKTAFKLIKSGYTYKFINGPINKKKFLNRKFLGVTEYIAAKFKQKKFAMLIYNKEL